MVASCAANRLGVSISCESSHTTLRRLSLCIIRVVARKEEVGEDDQVTLRKDATVRAKRAGIVLTWTTTAFLTKCYFAYDSLTDK